MYPGPRPALSAGDAIEVARSALTRPNQLQFSMARNLASAVHNPLAREQSQSRIRL